MRALIALLLVVLTAGCTRGLSGLRTSPGSFAVATPPFSSLIYVARADDVVLVIDLGWHGGTAALRRALREVGAVPDDVTDVFLTHSHRDHIGAWPLVRGARFHLAEAEAALFEGRMAHRDLPSSGGDVLLGGPGPWHGEVDVRPFARDTVFVLGGDTLRAYLLPGHTAGSAAYLFRGTLFVGDAFAWNPLTGLRRPARVFSADRQRSREGLRRVVALARDAGMERICNAHAKCFAADSAFLGRLTR